MQSVRDGGYPGVDSIVVARNNVLVAEAYYNGYGRDTLHDVRSASKSITSVLAGIAIEQGLFATMYSARRGGSTSGPGSPSPRRTGTTVSARIWWGRPGKWP
jgi:hypothetical protein